MERLRKLIRINQNFRKSVNLQMDFGDTARIAGYIPTRSSAAILCRYLQAFADKKGSGATILIGPYGKGKSHLLLVLLALICGGLPEEMWEKLAAENADIKTYGSGMQRGEQKYLPVLVSSVPGTDLNQAFLHGLYEALKREGLHEIAPETYFLQAVRVIAGWQTDYPAVYEEFCRRIRVEKAMSPESYMDALEHQNGQVLCHFKLLYPKLTAGSAFLPLFYADAMRVYEQVCRILTEECGYAGMFLVFDEFSKYIEGHGQEGFASDMKTLQDMCELAGNAETQVYLTLVAHKSIHEYGRKLNGSVKNAFRGVEGRIAEIRFVVSGQNNYELIANTIGKSEPDFTKEYEKLRKQETYEKLLVRSYALPCFSKLFSLDEFVQTVAKGAYPLTPLCAYALLSVSERVAQNERTIFTFLAEEGQGSLPWLLKRTAKGNLGIDCIYDYFKGLFRDAEDAPEIHGEWLKAEYALSRTADELEAAIIKAVAVIRMIHREEEFPARDMEILLALGVEEEAYQTAMAHLVACDILVYRNSLGVYAFRNNVGIDVEKAIAAKMQELRRGYCVCETLRNIAELQYELPKQYNQNYAITRYFQYEYLLPEQFFALQDTGYLFEEKFADGKILILVSEDTIASEEVQKHLDALGDMRCVALVPEHAWHMNELLLKYNAVKALAQDDTFIEENIILLQELMLCEEDIVFEVNGQLEHDFLPENGNAVLLQAGKEVVKCRDANAFNRILSDICEAYYRYSPKVNHELLNIEHIGAQYGRARDTVIRNILAGADCGMYLTGTTPAALVYRAAFVHTAGDAGSERLCAEIDTFLGQCAGEKRTCADLYLRLQGAGYGARKGIIPLFLAKKLADAQGAAVLYLGNSELAVSAENLRRVNEYPARYAIYIEPETAEKETYLKALEALFGEKQSSILEGAERLRVLVGSMQKWYRSLPQYTMVTRQFPDDKQEAVTALRNWLKRAEVNARELVFEQIPLCFGGVSYVKAATEMAEIKTLLNEAAYRLSCDVAVMVKEEFASQEQASLKGCLLEWYGKIGKTVRQYVFTTAANNFLQYLKQLETNDEAEIVARLSRVVLGVYIEDWTDGTRESFRRELHAVRVQIEDTAGQGAKPEEQNRIILQNAEGKALEKAYEADISDAASRYLKNMIDEALEEFGDTLEMNQKVAVLAKTIEGLLE